MKITIDKADTVFSQYIRLRDMKCVRCGSEVELNDKGLPVSHENSHYFGRGNEGVRFDPDDCDTLCFTCHKLWGGEGREEYKAFKVKQLGQARFDALDVKAHMVCRKDRKMAYLVAKAMLEIIMEKRAKGG